MNLRNKTISIILLCLTIILVMVLSSQLSGIIFEPGQPFFFESQDSPVGSSSGTPRLFDLSGLGRIVSITFLWVLLPASIVYFIISPTARRQVILRVLSMSITSFALIIIVRWLATSGGCSTGQFGASEMTGGVGNEITEVVFTPLNLPSFRYLGSFIMAIIIVVLVYRTWRRIQGWQPGKLDKIALQAESAVADLQAGANLGDTIKRCYFEMSVAIQDYHGHGRKIGMTPREFEASLHGFGLPQGNVKRLTRLFEEVRYGGKDLGEDVEREAIDLLNAIVEDCEKNRSGGKH
jgi:hypothetical protein